MECIVKDRHKRRQTERIHRLMDRYSFRQMGEQIDKQADRSTDGCAGGWTNKIDRLIDR